MPAGAYTYDLAELDRVASGLSRLATDYDTSGEDFSGVSGALGSGDVRDALDDFTDNWKRKRAKQTSMLRSANEALERIVAGYRDIDAGAAQTLRSDP